MKTTLTAERITELEARFMGFDVIAAEMQAWQSPYFGDDYTGYRIAFGVSYDANVDMRYRLVALRGALRKAGYAENDEDAYADFLVVTIKFWCSQTEFLFVSKTRLDVLAFVADYIDEYFTDYAYVHYDDYQDFVRAEARKVWDWAPEDIKRVETKRLLGVETTDWDEAMRQEGSQELLNALND